MSAVARQIRAVPARRPEVNDAPPRALAPVAAPEQTQSLVPFVMLCGAIIVAAFVGVLVLNTQMAQTAYDIRAMRIELAALGEQRGELLTALDANAAPQHLSTQAAVLGMVPADSVGFVSLEEGVVIDARGGG